MPMHTPKARNNHIMTPAIVNTKLLKLATAKCHGQLRQVSLFVNNIQVTVIQVSVC